MIKRDILLFLQKNPHKKLTKTAMRKHMEVPNHHRKLFHDAIKELEKEGLIAVSKKKRISLTKGLPIIIGRFYSNSKGYGFVVNREEKMAVFIPKNGVNEALNEDVVVAMIMQCPENSKNPEGKIVSILKHEVNTVVGTFMDSGDFGFVIPDDAKFQKDIYIPMEESLGAKSYDKVVCRITKYPKRNRKPEGKIIEVIGVKWDKGVDLLSLLKEKNIPHEFPAKVLRQSDNIPEQIEKEVKEKRLDLTKEIIFTIDGEDAKDLDDAISITKHENGHFTLGVHIADVSHYVKENSAIDKEAKQRGTSVYLINTVIPMLPKKLSNHVCSLQPNEERLTLSVFMEINPNGQVVSQKITESVISSKARLTYREVSDYLESNNPIFEEKYPFLLKEIKWMKELTHILRKKREDRGSIEFDFAECKIFMNENGDVEDVQKYERGIANDMIEECMLICNETVAKFFMERSIPFVYRVHSKPREERLEVFQSFIEEFGYQLNHIEDVEPKELQSLLYQVRGKQEEQAVQFLLLRSMMQARYSPIAKGHFGLATPHYTHFTSPIRRYPDLQIHRIIKEFLNHELTTDRKQSLESIVEESASIASKRERIAEQAEQEYKELKKVEFMKGKVGETYSGTISNMNHSSLTVMLDNTIEGVIPGYSIKEDSYMFDENTLEWVGSQGGKIKLGDPVVVMVKEVSIEKREIVFNIVSM